MSAITLKTELDCQSAPQVPGTALADAQAAGATRLRPRLGEAAATPSPLGLRIGLFAGPCHLVTLHDVLDYLGSTPLPCARLLREAHAGDIVLPAARPAAEGRG